jgi:predicted choloylglycine hydrolase
MQIHFTAISEPSLPGKKWQNLFFIHWEAYKTWLIENETEKQSVDLQTSQVALKEHMPEMWPTYIRLCELAGADEIASKFLTGYQPPFYVSGCSNAVLEGDDIQLVRNYDHHPYLFEGVQLFSKWNDRRVIATSDCLLGVLDGMNDKGLAVSLTFGGRKIIGEGFGMPFILRYILEFCSNVKEAVAALIRIPSHMAYNVTVVDKSGHYKTVQVAPNEKAVVTDAAFTTNHQKRLDWPENAAFNKTIERSLFLKNLLKEEGLSASDLVDAFMRKPLYNDLFKEGFGTLFTAGYHPKTGQIDLYWRGKQRSQSFDFFQEFQEHINFQQRKKRSKSFGLPFQGHTAKNITYSKPSLNESAPKEMTEHFLSEVWSAVESNS